jgi:HlyD family secretion protein
MISIRNNLLPFMPSGRRGLLVICVLFLVIVVGLLIPRDPGSTAAEPAKWAVVRRGAFSRTLIESGEVMAVSEAVIAAPRIRGGSIQITELVPEGTWVEIGDFLIQFDDSNAQAELTLAEEKLTSQAADLEKTRALMARTISNLENSQTLARFTLEQAELQLEASGFESEARREQMRLRLREANSELVKIAKQLESQAIINDCELAEATLKNNQAQTDIESIKTRLKLYRIVAPLAGMVTYKVVGSWNSSERLRNGYTAHAGEKLLSIPDLSRMQIRISLNEVDWPFICQGQAVGITLDAFPESTWQGQVRDIAKLAQQVSRRNHQKGFVAYIDVDGSDNLLKPGMTAKVEIILEQLNDVLFVQSGTVGEVASEPVVYSRGDKNPRLVVLGPRKAGWVVITQGVEEGDQLEWFRPRGEATFLGEAAVADIGAVWWGSDNDQP